MKKISIKILQKNNIISSRNIQKSNKKFYIYDRKIKVYRKKSKIEISKIKYIEKSKRKEKKIVKKLRKKPIEAQPEKIFKPVKKCNFNYKFYYKGINHNGYVREHNFDYLFDIDTTDSELIKALENMKFLIKHDYNQLNCPQRMNYIRIHYILQLSNNLDDIRKSSNTTKTSFSIKILINRLEDIFNEIINLLDSYVSVNIYKLEYVNYEFKHILEKE